MCQCPQGSWWDKKLEQCVTSKCSDLEEQGWGQDIYWCTNPSPEYGIAGFWNPTDCKCTCPYPYYHDVQTSKGCLLAPGHSESEYEPDCDRDDAACNGFDEDAWEDEQDRADWEWEQGADRDYDYDYDYDPGWD
ncbi:MAG: hypothetical protein Q4P84_05365 [Elusimicrobiales bacterium]|nr:hypothetical protein [Elusimicrobiales bacterium]